MSLEAFLDLIDIQWEERPLVAFLEFVENSLEVVQASSAAFPVEVDSMPLGPFDLVREAYLRVFVAVELEHCFELHSEPL